VDDPQLKVHIAQLVTLKLNIFQNWRDSFAFTNAGLPTEEQLHGSKL